MPRAGVRARQARSDQGWEPKGQRRVSTVEGRHAAVAEAAVRAQNSRARADDDRIPAEGGGGIDRARQGDRLTLTPEGGASRDVSGQQRGLPQPANVARERSGQGAAASLDEPDREVGIDLAGGPDGRRQVPVERDHQHRWRRGCLCARLHRLDRVLERRVVQLHHVLAGGALAVQAASEVHVDDVEPARAQIQIQSLDVHDDLVAELDRPDRPLVGPRRAPLARDLDGQRLGLDDDPPTQLQHQHRPSPRSPRTPPASPRSARRRRSPQ